jgi:hypothetical protein
VAQVRVAEVDIRAGVGRRVVVRSIKVDGGETVVSGGGADGTRRERRLAVQPDLASARRWLHTVRRIDRVEIDGARPTPGSVAHGVGHRRPMVRPVALATALGLAALGVPLLVDLAEG